MKEVIRNSVFETNSSSSHSVSVRGKRNINNNYYTNRNGFIETYLDEYGWHGDSCDEFKSKLQYALSMVLHTEYPGFSSCDSDFVVDQSILEQLDGYKLLLEAIRKHMDCEFILIKRWNGHTYPYGYIDHQSYEDYNSLRDFLEDWNVDAERFLFDDGVYITISNDNDGW